MRLLPYLSKTLDKGCVSWKELETSKYFHNLGRKACKYEFDSMNIATLGKVEETNTMPSDLVSHTVFPVSSDRIY